MMRSGKRIILTRTCLYIVMVVAVAVVYLSLLSGLTSLYLQPRGC